jgi:protein SCO1/2
MVVILICLAASTWAADKKVYTRTIEEYQIPDVTLLNQNGEEVHLKSYLDSDKLVAIDFIFGTCTTICPVLSVSFAHLQKNLGEDLNRVRLVSISIDPDNDTPELMKEHLQKYGAMTGWDAFTGKREHIIQVLKAFDAYVANKMDHFPLTILRVPGEKQWVRLYGLLSASDLKREYEQLARK